MIDAKERREKSNKLLKSMGIDYLEELPVIEDSNQVKLKSIDDICKRAIACLLSTQIACDIENDNYAESVDFFKDLFKKYNVDNCLLDKEKKLLNGNYTMQDAVDVEWTYECFWALIWALGIIPDIKDASSICDCNYCISLIQSSDTYEDFKSKCKLRDIEETLDMLDLYYRYNWATVEKQINENANIGSLNPEVVPERRRALEWLISDTYDWFDISLDT